MMNRSKLNDIPAFPIFYTAVDSHLEFCVVFHQEVLNYGIGTLRWKEPIFLQKYIGFERYVVISILEQAARLIAGKRSTVIQKCVIRIIGWS